MDSILKQLANPEWWFTVVVVGLIIGVAAAYVKDWFAKALSKLSLTLKKRYEAKARETEARTQKMLRHPYLLILEYLRVAFVLAGSLLLVSATAFLPAWHVLQTAFPAVDPVTLVLGVPAPSERLNQVFALALGLCGIVMWVIGLLRLKFCELTRRRLEDVATNTPVNVDVPEAGTRRPTTRRLPSR